MEATIAVSVHTILLLVEIPGASSGDSHPAAWLEAEAAIAASVHTMLLHECRQSSAVSAAVDLPV